MTPYFHPAPAQHSFPRSSLFQHTFLGKQIREYGYTMKRKFSKFQSVRLLHIRPRTTTNVVMYANAVNFLQASSAKSMTYRRLPSTRHSI